MTKRTTTLLTSIIAAVIGSATHADITGFKDYNEWANAVGTFDTIDFTGWQQGTVITDQYSHMGVTFTDNNDVISHTGSFVKDGEGLDGNWDLQITIVFDSPQLWIGVDHPGSAAIDLYFDSEFIGTFHNPGGGTGRFTGVLSNIAFNRARLHRPWTNTPPVIDDLHWGIPAPGALAVLAFAALLGGSRRRRT